MTLSQLGRLRRFGSLLWYLVNRGLGGGGRIGKGKGCCGWGWGTFSYVYRNELSPGLKQSGDSDVITSWGSPFQSGIFPGEERLSVYSVPQDGHTVNTDLYMYYRGRERGSMLVAIQNSNLKI